ncbi:MAG: oxygen-independent coproporphyrinogen III oxidase-like protein [Sutterella wadsworthensis]|nr:oxygen-independent coproporphyrinogen III oxidase-like protein [Sutterella wadsworthensis]
MREIPLALYLHWPWCVRKCPYCDFNSHAIPQGLDEVAYVDLVLRDLSHWIGRTEGRPISSVFIGGGTPSLMSGHAVDKLLSGANRMFGFTSDCEITLEANPGTTDESRFKAFKSAGVNRISIGVQSFMNEKLQTLGRIHSSDDARRAAQHASEVFGNFNLDLMFALPGETHDEVATEVETAVQLGATHLSFYQLTIEPGTAFAKRLPAGLPDDDTCADMSDLVIERLTSAGFDHYEVSGYAKPGKRCRHNLNYWQFGDYLAAGAGAHGKLTTREGILREVREMSPRRYAEKVKSVGHACAEKALIDSEDLPFEFMLNVLRLTEGVPATLFEARTGLALSTLTPQLSDLRNRGLLVPDTTRIAPTAQGRAFLSDLQEAFL